MSKTERQQEQNETEANIIRDLDTMVIKVGKCEREEEDDVQKQNDGSTVQETMQCKICLQSSKDSTQQFIQPCLCTGSLRHVHQQCFQQWMKRLIIQKNISQSILPKSVACELCKMEYQIQTNLNKVCISCQKFKLKARNKTCQFVVLLSLILGSIIILAIAAAIVPKGIFSVGLSNEESAQKQNGVWQKIIVIFCLCILGLILILSLCIFIQKYCFTSKVSFSYKDKYQNTMRVIFQVLQQSTRLRR